MRPTAILTEPRDSRPDSLTVETSAGNGDTFSAEKFIWRRH